MKEKTIKVWEWKDRECFGCYFYYGDEMLMEDWFPNSPDPYYRKSPIFNLFDTPEEFWEIKTKFFKGESQ